MKQSPGWYPQPFPPDGGITAGGLRNQLGRPALGLLTVLARESAQNSWDARSSAQVDFSLTLGKVSPVHMHAWRSMFRVGMPKVDDELFPLRKVLNGQSITYLTVSDRGTTGLNGPTRSDQTAEPGRRNWLSFVLNSGEARDTEGGGGTYGYGKGVFFLVSRVGAVIIYTRFKEASGYRSRLIASVLWREFTAAEVPHTGRHWWGLPQADHCEPLENDEADHAARQLGMPNFSEHETGTTVVIIDPLLPDPSMPEDADEQLDLPSAGRFLADALGYNLWPISLDGRSERLVPRVTVDGTEIDVPSPANDAVLAHFAAAYRALDETAVEGLHCGRPKRRLARVAHTRTFGAITESAAAGDLGLEGAPHHVCLLRKADLVVKYAAGPPGPNPMVGYAGVVKVDDDLDDVFAKSEPPTHDAWIDSQLQGLEPTFVRVLHRRIRDKWEAMSGIKRQAVDLAELPVAEISRKLGHLLAAAGASAQAAQPPRPSGDDTGSNGPQGGDGGYDSIMGGRGKQGGRHAPRGDSTKRTRNARLKGAPTFIDFGGRTVLSQTVQIPGTSVFEAEVRVLIGDGGRESDSYVGAPYPEVLGWRAPGGAMMEGSTVTLDGTMPDWEILVLPVREGVLEISVRSTK